MTKKELTLRWEGLLKITHWVIYSKLMVNCYSFKLPKMKKLLEKINEVIFFMTFLYFFSYDLFGDFLVFAIFLIMYFISQTLESFSKENKLLIEYCEDLPSFMSAYMKALHENNILSIEEIDRISISKLGIGTKSVTYPKSYLIFLFKKYY